MNRPSHRGRELKESPLSRSGCRRGAPWEGLLAGT
jgi:hypothetical protein